MAIDILRAVTSLLATCSRHASRAARKLRGPHLSRRSMLLLPLFLSSRRRKVGEELPEKIVGLDEELKRAEEEEEVWRRGIIMGEKCQPLDFSGAIYYDSDGRQVAVAPTPPKSPMIRCRSPLAVLIAEEKMCE